MSEEWTYVLDTGDGHPMRGTPQTPDQMRYLMGKTLPSEVLVSTMFLFVRRGQENDWVQIFIHPDLIDESPGNQPAP